MTNPYLKYIILGDSYVGKSAFLKRLTRNIDPSTVPLYTSGVDFEIYYLNDQKLQIWEICGDPIFRSLYAQYLKDIDCIILMFALDDIVSYHNLYHWLKVIDEFSECKNILIIGNKSDIKQFSIKADFMTYPYVESNNIAFNKDKINSILNDLNNKILQNKHMIINTKNNCVSMCMII